MNKEQLEKLKSKIEMHQNNTSLSSGAQDFIKLLNLGETDEVAAKRLNELSRAPKAEVIAYGKEKGLHFTEEDMKVVTDEILEASDELSDVDLENVAGGAEARTVIVSSAVIGAVALVLATRVR